MDEVRGKPAGRRTSAMTAVTGDGLLGLSASPAAAGRMLISIERSGSAGPAATGATPPLGTPSAAASGAASARFAMEPDTSEPIALVIAVLTASAIIAGSAEGSAVPAIDAGGLAILYC